MLKRFFMLLLLLIFLPSCLAEGLQIHFLDVGQADAAIILCDDEVLMIDGGNAGDSSFIYSYLRNTLGIEKIDYMIASHPHEDHIGGLSGALNACKVGVLYSPVLEYDSKTFSSMLKYATKQGISLNVPAAGDAFSLGSATVQFLSAGIQNGNTNDTSVVVKIEYGETSILFTGDAEWDSEHDLLERNVDLKSTLLKVGHHGSDSSTCYAFLRAVAPQYAVISVGANNSYGHPTEAVLSRLQDAECEVYRTDLNGTIVCSSDGKTLEFAIEKSALETVWDWGK